MTDTTSIRVKTKDHAEAKKIMHENELDSLSYAFEHILITYKKYRQKFPLEFKSGYEVAKERGLLPFDENGSSE